MISISWTIYRVIALLELLFLTLIIVYDIYKSRKDASEHNTKTTVKKPKQQAKHIHILLYSLTRIYITICYIHSINLVLTQNNAYHISNNYGCYLRTIFSMIVYQTSRFVLYCLLLVRLYASYRTTTYEYSLKFIIIPLFVFILIFYMQTFKVVLHLDWSIQYDPLTIHSCHYIQLNPFLLLIERLYDMIISLSLCILFMKPLHKILKSRTVAHKCAVHSTNVTPKTAQIVEHTQYWIDMFAKTTLLTALAIFSSFIAVLIYALVFNSLVVIILDNIINVISVILMKKNHAKTYKITCGRFDSCCLCLCCCNYRSNLNSRPAVNFQTEQSDNNSTKSTTVELKEISCTAMKVISDKNSYITTTTMVPTIIQCSHVGSTDNNDVNRKEIEIKSEVSTVTSDLER
eukprot:267559_1